jgi:hypothetical protein
LKLLAEGLQIPCRNRGVGNQYRVIGSYWNGYSFAASFNAIVKPYEGVGENPAPSIY